MPKKVTDISEALWKRDIGREFTGEVEAATDGLAATVKDPDGAYRSVPVCEQSTLAGMLVPGSLVAVRLTQAGACIMARVSKGLNARPPEPPEPSRLPKHALTLWHDETSRLVVEAAPGTAFTAHCGDSTLEVTEDGRTFVTGRVLKGADGKRTPLFGRRVEIRPDKDEDASDDGSSE